MIYRVDVSEPAESEADKIYLWLLGRSPKGAQNWWTSLLKTLDRLKNNPTGLGLAPEADAFEEPLRQILFKTRYGNMYRALFILRCETVYVLSVRGFGQDLVSPDEIEFPD